MVLRRLLAKRALMKKRPGYWSAFGGHWTDRRDAEMLIARKLDAGELDEEDAQRLVLWARNGYAVLEGAVPTDVIDEVNAAIDRAWATGDAAVKVEIGGVYHDLSAPLRAERYKILDLYAHVEAILRAAYAEPIQRFLRQVFERDALLFQSLNFERGSGQPMHQDTAYVVVDSPVELLATWIALEDYQPGSGELQYYPGSQRMEEFLFRGRYKNWNQERDGDAVHKGFLASVHGRARDAGLSLQRFEARKGDVLFWSGDLAHGGSEITDPTASRRSLVSHYCPADVRPYYFSYRAKHRTVKEYRPGCLYASSYYTLD